MLIKEWMSRNVITLDSEKALQDAAKIFKTRVISMLPILERGRLAGIVTDGDLKKAMPSKATTLDRFELTALLDNIKISTVMKQPVITICEDRTVDEAASLMLAKGISGMPVLDSEGRLSGIITKSDIFRCFVSFTGVAGKGQIFAFQLKDRPGVIKNITEMIRNKGGRLSSIMTSYDDIEEGFRKVFFHVYDLVPDQFDSLADQFGKTGEMTYMADLSRDFRRIC